MKSFKMGTTKRATIVLGREEKGEKKRMRRRGARNETPEEGEERLVKDNQNSKKNIKLERTERERERGRGKQMA